MTSRLGKRNEEERKAKSQRKKKLAKQILIVACQPVAIVII